MDNEDEQVVLTIESGCSSLDLAANLVSGHEDGQVIVWDIETRQTKKQQLGDTVSKIKFLMTNIVCLVSKLGTFYKLDQNLNVTMQMKQTQLFN